MNIFKGKRGLILAAASTLLMMLYAQFVLGSHSECFMVAKGPSSLGLTFGYSQDQVMHFFNSRSFDQLRCYEEFIKIWDSIFPIVYTLMYILWLNYFFKNKWLIFLIPILHMLLDWSENSVELLMLHEYLSTDSVNTKMVYWGSLLTSLKWIVSIINYALIIAGIGLKIKQYSSSRKAN